jgi:hypothetical protein
LVAAAPRRRLRPPVFFSASPQIRSVLPCILTGWLELPLQPTVVVGVWVLPTAVASWWLGAYPTVLRRSTGWPPGLGVVVPSSEGTRLACCLRAPPNKRLCSASAGLFARFFCCFSSLGRPWRRGSEVERRCCCVLLPSWPAVAARRKASAGHHSLVSRSRLVPRLPCPLCPALCLIG